VTDSDIFIKPNNSQLPNQESTSLWILLDLITKYTVSTIKVNQAIIMHITNTNRYNTNKSIDLLLMVVVIRARSQGSGHTAAIRFIVHPVF
jgi:hypothetical protein